MPKGGTKNGRAFGRPLEVVSTRARPALGPAFSHCKRKPGQMGYQIVTPGSYASFGQQTMEAIMTSTMSHCWVRTFCAWVRKRTGAQAHLIAYPRNNNVRIQQWNHCWCHHSLSNGAPPNNHLFTCRAPLRQNIERLKFSPGRARRCKRTKLGYRVPQLRPGSARPCTVNGV